MEKKSLLKKRLLEVFGEKISFFGYDEKNKNQRFYKKINDGWACVHLSFVDHEEDFDVILNLAVRIDKVEDIVNLDNDLLKDSEKKKTATIGIEIGNLSQGKQKRWSINKEADISQVAESILGYYEKYGDSYIIKNSSITAIYELLSSKAKKSWIHSPIHGERAKRVISMALLLNHSDIEKQISDYIQFLEEINDWGLPDFLNFAKSLPMAEGI